MQVEFKAWPKIPRGQNEKITITEKMDGTNGCIVISDNQVVAIQSRNKFITPEDDNAGFARWVLDNKEELAKLGNGYHYGEWVGPGIQNNPHCLPEKRFYLFNSGRWKDNPGLPECCHVVKELVSKETYHELLITGTLMDLKASAHLEGYTPEGIVVYYHNGKRMEKHTFRDQEGKWKINQEESSTTQS